MRFQFLHQIRHFFFNTALHFLYLRAISFDTVCSSQDLIAFIENSSAEVSPTDVLNGNNKWPIYDPGILTIDDVAWFEAS